MHISRLPKSVLSTLNKTYQDKAFLKKVQTHYCSKLAFHELCPYDCWRCTRALESIADRYAGSGVDSVGMWQRIIESHVLERIERG